MARMGRKRPDRSSGIGNEESVRNAATVASRAAVPLVHSRSSSEELSLAGSHPAHPVNPVHPVFCVLPFLSPSVIARVGIATGPGNTRGDRINRMGRMTKMTRAAARSLAPAA